jgi:hypothetical protein
MAQIFFPYTTKEIRKTCLKFFKGMKEDSSAIRIRKVLVIYDFDDLGDNKFVNWLQLDDEINDLTVLIRIKRQQRDRIGKENLRKALMDTKNILIALYPNSNMILNSFGFIVKVIKSEKAPTKESVEKILRRVEAGMNSLNEAKAIAEAKKKAKANAKNHRRWRVSRSMMLQNLLFSDWL